MPRAFVGSLRIPRTVDGLKTLLQVLEAYLVANPGLEVKELNLTAIHANVLGTALLEAEIAVCAQRTTMQTLLQERDASYEAFSRQLRGLNKELDQLLDPLDPRWQRFGFNLPGASETPDVPENVSVVLIGANAAAVKWEAAARADYYRVWVQVNGVDLEPRTVGSPADLDFTIEALPVNATIEIAVSAVNNGGESGRSTVATVTTH
jgi:hypothetical protein